MRVIEKIEDYCILMPYKWQSIKAFFWWGAAMLVGWLIILTRFLEIKEFFERRRKK